MIRSDAGPAPVARVALSRPELVRAELVREDVGLSSPSARTLVARRPLALVVDPAFGDRLCALARRMHAWAVDTPANRAGAERYWEELGTFSFERRGVTLFAARMAEPRAAWVAHVIRAIDTHHARFSYDPPFDALELHGIDARDLPRRALARCGLTELVVRDGACVVHRTPGA